MTQPASVAQIRRIHVLSRNAGLDEDTRRDVIAKLAHGKRSSKELDIVEARDVIDHLEDVARGAKPLARGALRLSGPYVGKVRALWISGWHLGVVRDRTDAAMVAFIKRQTGLDSANWLRSAADARKAVEGLKKWLEREAGVEWGADKDAGADHAKRAVYLALRRRLTAFGVDKHFIQFPGRHGIAFADAATLDRLTKAGGEALRPAIARAA